MSLGVYMCFSLKETCPTTKCVNRIFKHISLHFYTRILKSSFQCVCFCIWLTQPGVCVCETAQRDMTGRCRMCLQALGCTSPGKAATTGSGTPALQNNSGWRGWSHLPPESAPEWEEWSTETQTHTLKSQSTVSKMSESSNAFF